MNLMPVWRPCAPSEELFLNVDLRSIKALSKDQLEEAGFVSGWGAKAGWIDECDGVAVTVGVRTDSAVQTDGITLQVASDARIVIPMPVLMQPRLRIEILARQYCEGSLS